MIKNKKPDGLENEAKDVLKESGDSVYLRDERAEAPDRTFDDEDPEQVEDRYLQQGEWDEDAKTRLTSEGELRKSGPPA